MGGTCGNCNIGSGQGRVARRRGSAMRDRTRSRRRDRLGKAWARRRRDSKRNSRARSKRTRSSRRRRSATVKRREGRKRVGARRSLEALFHWRKALESSWDLDSTTVPSSDESLLKKLQASRFLSNSASKNMAGAAIAKVLLCLLLGALGDDYEGRGWPKWPSFSKNKTNKTEGSGGGWFSNKTWPKWFSRNKTEAPTFPCGCSNWKGVLAPKVDLAEFSIDADEKCERPTRHASMTPGKFCSCDKGRAANWDQALSEAQKAVDDAVSPIVSEMMDAITALQEELGMIVDSSSMKKLKPKVTSFPRKQGEGLWVCCCQSGEAGKCRTDAKQTGWKAAHHEAPADACENEATEATEGTEDTEDAEAEATEDTEDAEAS
eukprot:s1248_g10.t1